MKWIIIIVLALSVILGFAFWKFGPNLFSKPQPKGPVTLTYWGFWEEDNSIKALIDVFQTQNPNIQVKYAKQTLINYRTRVQTQIRSGVGPDVFLIHNSWLPMLESDLTEAPTAIFNISDYKSAFYPIAETNFIRNNKILAAPPQIDGLALYYNEEILNGVGGQPPKNWQEFIDLATKMTVKDSSGIKTAGAALGATSNVDYWSDIIGLLLLQQPGVDLTNLATPQVSEILKFYTDFVIDPKRKTWDTTLPSSSSMFASGKLGFYFAPSNAVRDLRIVNPSLRFKVVAVPQLAGKSISWASYWADAVSKTSKNPEEAWKFVKFLTSEPAEKLFFEQAAQTRIVGEPYSLVSLGSEVVNDPILGAFVAQGPNYKSWYLASNTQDNGINDEMIKYFENGINAILQGSAIDTSLQTINGGVKQVLDKYTKPQPSAPVKN